MLQPDARRLEAALARLAAPFHDLAVRAVDLLTPTYAIAPAPEQMQVRHLDVSALGRWIYLPGRPLREGPKGAREPAIFATAGRLVGIRPGDLGRGDATPTRVLVIAQGSALAELPFAVDAPVDVAPREWN